MGDIVPMRDYILSVAGRLFYEFGLRAIGIDRVIAEAGIAKATLYRHFPTKELLIATYLSRRSEEVIVTLEAQLKNQPAVAEMRVNALFDALAVLARDGFRGCAFVRAISEYLASDEIRAVVKRHKHGVRSLLGRELCLSANAANEDGALLEGIFLLYEGALSTAMIYKTDEGVLAAQQAALRLLKS